MSYAREMAATPQQQLRNIARAYTLAGVKPPTVAGDALDALAAEPGAAAVAATLAREAYAATDATTYLEAALDRIARAHAADALRAAVERVFESVALAGMRETLTQAAADLAPAFARTVTSLTKAAAKLDRDKPLDVNNAVRDDTTKELKAAQAALAALGTFASIHNNGPTRNGPPALARAIPVLALPACVVEVVVPSFATKPPALNAAEMEGSETVRRLSRDLARDLDAALVAVARGEYPGVSFTLADPEQLRARQAEADRAHTTRAPKPGETGRGPVIVR